MGGAEQAGAWCPLDSTPGSTLSRFFDAGCVLFFLCLGCALQLLDSILGQSTAAVEKLAQASTDKCRATVTIFPEDGCVDMSVNQVPGACLVLFVYLFVCLSACPAICPSLCPSVCVGSWLPLASCQACVAESQGVLL